MEDLMYHDLRMLLSAKEIIPIESSPYWISAVRQAADKYRKQKIAEALPDAWDQYMLTLQTGIAFSHDEKLYEMQQRKRTLHERTIVAGRLLNNEPGDLNF